MKKFKLTKFVSCVLILASALALALNPIGASAEWKKDRVGSWWYAEGNSWATGWREIDGSWYYFNSDGYMVTSWLKSGDKWYYLDDFSGKMYSNTVMSGYSFGIDGALQVTSNTITPDIAEKRVKEYMLSTLPQLNETDFGTKIILKSYFFNDTSGTYFAYDVFGYTNDGSLEYGRSSYKYDITTNKVTKL